MQVLISDTSVLIDLKRGSLLKASFRLPFQFTVPDLLYERELKGQGGEELIGLGLAVEELDGDGVMLARTYRQRAPALSLPDCFALALAQTRSWILLSGDRALRQLADDEAIECHGVLWLLDEIDAAGAASVQELRDGLIAIWQHPRCRLPRREVRGRLARYAKHQPSSAWQTGRITPPAHPTCMALDHIATRDRVEPLVNAGLYEALGSGCYS